MGFCTDEEYERFLKVCPAWQRDIIEAGITLIKYWFEISKEEQTRRFSERINDPRKIWKLSPMDLESHRRWYDYARARDAMFAATDIPESPWRTFPPGVGVWMRREGNLSMRGRSKPKRKEPMKKERSNSTRLQ